MRPATVILTLLVVVAVWLLYRKFNTSDRGVGDSVAALFQFLGIEKRPGCGCEARHKGLNEMLKYS